MRLTSVLTLLAVSALQGQNVPPAHPLFERDEVHEMHLRFQQPDWFQQLVANFNANAEDVPYIEASFRWRDVEFEKVGVRIKGNSTARVPGNKKPFRIKFNEYVKGQKIDGIDSINFNNFNMDPSMVREKAYFELAAEAGMKAPRMNYAALFVNDEFWGLYFLGEVIDDEYLKTRYPKGDRDGWLYKGDIGSTLEDRGDDKAAYKRTYEKKTHEDEDDWSDLIGLVAALNRGSDEDRLARLREVLDIDSFLYAMALDNLTVNLDSYVAMSQNYYLYRRESDNRFEWLVWDPSLAFGAFNSGLSTAQMKALPLEWTRASSQTAGGPGGVRPGGPGGGAAPLATKLWAMPEVKARYTEIYRKLANEVYNADKIVARMNILRDLIRPWVERDPNKLHTLAQFDAAMTSEPAAGGLPGGPGGGGGGSAPALESFVRERIEAVRALLAERQ